jgi:hypothetical protein
MNRIVLSAAFSLIASSAFAGQFLNPPSDVRQPVVIVDDGGGSVYDFENQAFKYNVEQRRVEIRGSCRSACTLALSVQKVCVGPGAVVKWHHAFNSFDHSVREDVTQEMLSTLPPRVRHAVEGRVTVNYNPQATLTYSQLVELGIPDCDNGTQVARAVPYDPSRPSVAYASPAQVAAKPKTTYTPVSYPEPQQPQREAVRKVRRDTTNPIVSLIRLPFLPLAAVARAFDRVGRK